MHEGSQFMSVRDVAEAFGLTPARVYQMVAAGQVPSVRHGRAIRIPRGAWDSWLRDQEDLASRSAAHKATSARR